MAAMAGVRYTGRRVEPSGAEKSSAPASRPPRADVLRPVTDVMAVAAEERATRARDAIGVAPPVGRAPRGAVQVVRVAFLAAVAVTSMVV